MAWAIQVIGGGLVLVGVVLLIRGLARWRRHRQRPGQYERVFRGKGLVTERRER